jgi:hypothetical protein
LTCVFNWGIEFFDPIVTHLKNGHARQMKRSSAKTWKIRNATSEFKSLRGQFYLDLAQDMKARPGEPVSKLLGKYADRYRNQAIGIVCSHWLDLLQTNTSTFSEAIRETVPQEDFVILAASERCGDLRVGLESLAKNILGLQAINKEIWKAAVAVGFMLVFAHVYVGIQAFVVLPKMYDAMKRVADIHSMGGLAPYFFGGADLVRAWWWLYGLAVVAIVLVTKWALRNYVGKARRWLDNNILAFQIARDFNSASFFVTLGSITKMMGSQVIQVHEGLAIMHRNAYPWLRWQVEKIQANLRTKPNAKGEIFDTGIASRKAYFRILDAADYAEISTMLENTGAEILATAPAEISARTARVKWVVIALSVAIMFGLHIGTYSVINAFETAVKLKSLR